MEERNRKSAHWLVQISIGGIIAALAAIVFAPLAAPILSGEVHIWIGLSQFWRWLVYLNWLVIGLISLLLFVFIMYLKGRRKNQYPPLSDPVGVPFQPSGAWNPQPRSTGIRPPVPVARELRTAIAERAAQQPSGAWGAPSQPSDPWAQSVQQSGWNPQPQRISDWPTKPQQPDGWKS